MVKIKSDGVCKVPSKELAQSLFMEECLNFGFTFDGWFSWLYKPWLTDLFLLALRVCYAIAFWTLLFLMRYKAFFMLLFTSICWVIFLLLLSRFSFCFWPSTVWLWYVWFRSFVFIVLGVLWTYSAILEIIDWAPVF